MFLIYAWNDFYQNEPDVTISDGSRQVCPTEKSNYFVKNCLFHEIINSSISFNSTSEDTAILAEDTSFSRCSSDENGGSIFFSDKGQFSQNRVCSYRSKASKSGVFCHITVSEKYNNKLYESSISCSGNDSYQGNSNILLIGSCNISNINLTNTKIEGLSLYKLDKVTRESFLTQSSFANNSQTFGDEIDSSSISSEKTSSFTIKLCNFLYNNGTEFSNSGMIGSYGCNTLILNCSLIGNKGNKYKIYLGDGTLTVDSCFINDEQGDYGDPKYNNNVLDHSTALLSHYSTFECHAEYPISYNKQIITNFKLIRRFFYRLATSRPITLAVLYIIG